MIDLHLHTTYSDGDYSVRDLINILNEKKIKLASITDHNSVDAHREYRDSTYDRLYDGKMIMGSEIQTLMEDYLIEVLVYGYDLDHFKEYVDETRKKFWDFHYHAYQELLSKARALGLKYQEPSRPLENGYYCNMKFQDAIAACYEENKGLVDERILKDHLYFYRHEFQNPNSIFYIDNSASFPKIEDLIRVAHECHGLCVLAHIDEYQSIEDKGAFLDALVHDTAIDDIECFHPSISRENTKKYMDYAKSHNLLISAGSDFHGPHLPHRKGIDTIATKEEVTILKKLR